MQGSSDTDLAPDDKTGAAAADVERRRDLPVGESEGETNSVPSPSPAIATESGSTDAGITLVAEASDLVDERRFAEAARVLESAARLRPDDPDVLRLTAIANAHRRQRQTTRSALARLSEDFGSAATTWQAVAEVAMARFQFDPAQRAARTAVQMAPRSADTWQTLAAAYAGHGWFDEATSCIKEATAIDPAQSHPSSDSLTFGQWQIGRALNFWAITRSYVAILAMFGVLYMGLLGLALALSVPMLLREVRVRQLPDQLRRLADLAWRDEHQLRVLNAVVVLAVLIAWVVAFSISR